MARKLSAVVLAAGDVTILDRPKELLPIESTPLVRWIVNRLSEAGVAEVLVVAGSHRSAIEEALAGTSARIVETSASGPTPLGSIAAGVQAASPDADAYLVVPADMPFLTTDILGTLLRRFDGSPLGILVPAFQNVPGYPLFFDRRYRDALLGLKERGDLFAILSDNARDVLDVHLLSDAVVFDVDDEDDYEAVHRRLGLPSPTARLQTHDATPPPAMP